MPPKGPSKGQPTIPARGQTQQSTVKNVVDAALAPENRSVLRAVGIFAAGVAVLHSGWGAEILLFE